MMDMFLLMGQSNMAGRGLCGEVPPINNERIFKLVNGRFQKMWEPVVQDRPFSGIGPSASFAEEYAAHYNKDVGLIPCADGGTALEQWMPGTALFDNAVNNTRLAMRSGGLTGILWHQGETDCEKEEHYTTYARRLYTMVMALYQSLGVSDVPFIAGELAPFPYGNNPCVKENYGKINEQLGIFEKKDKRFLLVSAKGLTANEDMLHINARSQREFGRRYFEAYSCAQNV